MPKINIYLKIQQSIGAPSLNNFQKAFFALLDFKICHKFSIGFRSADFGGQISTGTSFSTRNSETSRHVWTGALSCINVKFWPLLFKNGIKWFYRIDLYLYPLIFPSTLTKGPIPPEKKNPQDMTDGPSFWDFGFTGRFLAGMLEWSLWNNFVFFGFDRIIVSSRCPELSRNSGPFSRYFLANSIRFCLLIPEIKGFFSIRHDICHFWSKTALRPLFLGGWFPAHRRASENLTFDR